jgi:DNA-binding response OmpR family regulator
VKPKIFVVEDDQDISRLLKTVIEQGGFDVHVFSDCFGVIEAAETLSPAVILLDIMLPSGDGFELCRQLRQNPRCSGSAIIFLSARNSESDRVLGLELGADDYICKPFSPRELLARIRAVLRGIGAGSSSLLMNFGDLEINTAAMLITLKGESVPTTTVEFRLLHALAISRGRTVSRQRLIDLVWGSGHNVDPRSLDVYISRLREKIERNNRRYIRTVRGVGYCFEPPNRDYLAS